MQQRRSLGFAAWALINDPGNARYALDLVKRMKAAARQARSKPGHAWDAYTEMAKDLGRSARHFLPPFWEEAGRTYKDLGNPTYAGRALNKSLEAERVHALPADRARRRDVVLEFVLSGCLSGNALSEYGDDLQGQYPPEEAFAIFRDLCVRRTRGGMAPWATLPKDFNKLAKAAGLDGDAELESWLEEVIDAPAMGRAPHQFWKTCSAHCKRIVARSPAFAVALLRHTRPEERYYGESKLGPWFDLLEEWGVLEYLWEDERRGRRRWENRSPTGSAGSCATQVPAPTRTLQLLEKLAHATPGGSGTAAAVDPTALTTPTASTSMSWRRASSWGSRSPILRRDARDVRGLVARDGGPSRSAIRTWSHPPGTNASGPRSSAPWRRRWAVAAVP